jgi:hypothetical protein
LLLTVGIVLLAVRARLGILLGATRTAAVAALLPVLGVLALAVLLVSIRVAPPSWPWEPGCCPYGPGCCGG